MIGVASVAGATIALEVDTRLPFARARTTVCIEKQLVGDDVESTEQPRTVLQRGATREKADDF